MPVWLSGPFGFDADPFRGTPDSELNFTAWFASYVTDPIESVTLYMEYKINGGWLQYNPAVWGSHDQWKEDGTLFPNWNGGNPETNYGSSYTDYFFQIRTPGEVDYSSADVLHDGWGWNGFELGSGMWMDAMLHLQEYEMVETNNIRWRMDVVAANGTFSDYTNPPHKTISWPSIDIIQPIGNVWSLGSTQTIDWDIVNWDNDFGDAGPYEISLIGDPVTDPYPIAFTGANNATQQEWTIPDDGQLGGFTPIEGDNVGTHAITITSTASYPGSNLYHSNGEQFIYAYTWLNIYPHLWGLRILDASGDPVLDVHNLVTKHITGSIVTAQSDQTFNNIGDTINPDNPSVSNNLTSNTGVLTVSKCGPHKNEDGTDNWPLVFGFPHDYTFSATDDDISFTKAEDPQCRVDTMWVLTMHK
jgi:hypothetical protein